MNWIRGGLGVAALLIATGAGSVAALGAQPALDGADPLAALGAPAADSIVVSATYMLDASGRAGRLDVAAEVPAGWHIFSLTQPPGGPLATKLTLDPASPIRLTGEFVAAPAPSARIDELAFKGLRVEEHEGRVVWSAPFELNPGADPAQLSIRGTVRAMRCMATTCLPPSDFPFSATRREAPRGEYQKQRGHVTIRGHVEPAGTPLGSTWKLVLSAAPAEGWHVYARADRDPKEISKPTLIVVEEPASWVAGPPVASSQPVEHTLDVGGKPIVQRYHEGVVTWTTELKVPADAAAGSQRLTGLMGFQVCYDRGCDLPEAVRFEATIPLGGAAAGGKLPLAFREAKYAEAARAAEGPPPSAAQVSSAPPSQSGLPPLVGMLGAAFVGGLILNLMPCVLPVLGLKLLSFVEQGGQSRGRVFALNLANAVGIISVFLVLASLAAGAGLAWGQQFTYTWFNVAMAALVFAMALSFLGVWEIPIPGFSGRSTAMKLANQEGLVGAVFKGMLTTLLATPCSGPFLGSVFGLTLVLPTWQVYLLFFFVGLGMSSPYLLVGVMPGLVRYLPRPGAWMDTFKQLMGFVLLASVVMIFSFIQDDYRLATLALLIGVWFACWWIGRVPLTAEAPQRFLGWLAAAAITAAVAWFSFTQLVPHKTLIAWEPFSQTRLAEAQAQGKTVMVDFTADWCLSCKTNLLLAINTPEVSQLVARNEVVPLLADWTDGSPEIKEVLNRLGSNSIPVLAIYPAGAEEPIVLRDLLLQSQVLEALQRAGPSQGRPVGSTAMRQRAAPEMAIPE